MFEMLHKTVKSCAILQERCGEVRLGSMSCLAFRKDGLFIGVSG